MSCPGGLFFDEANDACGWQCPTSTTSRTSTTTTTTTTTTSIITTTNTELPENCFHEKCKYGTDGPEYYRNFSASCGSYIECTFDVWCAHECKWGLIFDNRSTELIKPGCKLPPLCPNCLSKNLLSQQDLEAEQHMENSSVVEDVSQMNSPMCTYTHQETCDNMEIFQPVYSPGARSGTGSGYCTNQFRICYRGWDCLMRCDGDLILDVNRGRCVEKSSRSYCQKL